MVQSIALAVYINVNCPVNCYSRNHGENEKYCSKIIVIKGSIMSCESTSRTDIYLECTNILPTPQLKMSPLNSVRTSTTNTL